MDNLRLFTQNKRDNNESLTKTEKRQRFGEETQTHTCFWWACALTLSNTTQRGLNRCLLNPNKNNFSFLISLSYKSKLPLIQVHLKKLNMLKRFSFSRNLFQKVKRSYMLDFEVFYMQSKTLEIVFCLWLELTANESQKPVSQNIRIFTFEFQ